MACLLWPLMATWKSRLPDVKYQSREWCLLTESESAQLIGINNTRGLNGPDCPNRSEHDLLLKLKKSFLRFKRILFKTIAFQPGQTQRFSWRISAHANYWVPRSLSVNNWERRFMFAANVNVNVGGDSSDEKYQGMNIDILSASFDRAYDTFWMTFFGSWYRKSSTDYKKKWKSGFRLWRWIWTRWSKFFMIFYPKTQMKIIIYEQNFQANSPETTELFTFIL